MVKTDGATDWRSTRRQSARATILEAAWAAVREEGLAALSLRDLARRSGITTPTVYAYFDSKRDIYDAMFRQAADDFLSHMSAPFDVTEPSDLLLASLRRFVSFCTADLGRYQLLFQRTIPDFEPSPGSYGPAVRALELSADVLTANRVTDPRHLDLWTALTTGLVSQQIANDPGGDRWVSLIEDSVAMFLAHCRQSTRSTRAATKAAPRRSDT
jgi:AcrR family transcriptional regulator